MDLRETGCLAGPRTRRIGAELEVVADAELGKDAAPLRHQRDAAFDDLMGRQGVEIGSVERDSATFGPLQPGDCLEEGRLARAVGAEDDDGLALRDLDVDAVECPVLAVAQRKGAHLKHRRRPDRR